MDNLMKPSTFHISCEKTPAPIGEISTNYLEGASKDRTIITAMPDDTMAGEIEIGDKIVIDTTPRKYFEDGIFAFFMRNIFMVKRLQFIRNDVLIIPTNKYYETFEVNGSSLDLVIVGRVIASQEIRRH